MKKKHVLAFLKSRKRGVYTMLAEMYADVVTSMAITMAIEVIKEDLEKELGETVELHYHSLSQAVLRLKRKGILKATVSPIKIDFKNANELPQSKNKAGSFTVD
jgi:hypothetical protein